MKTYKFVKIICIFLLFMIIFSNINDVVSAKTSDDVSTTITNLYSGESSDAGEGAGEARKIIGRIITIVQVFGVFVSIIMLIFLGIKYMIASAGDKAEIKKHLTTYVVGAVVLFGSAGILQIVKAFFIDATAPVK